MGIYTDHLSPSQISALRAEFDRMLGRARLEGTYNLPERTRLPAFGQWREHECSRCGHYEYSGAGRLQGHVCPHVPWDWQKAAVLDAFWAYEILTDGQRDCRLHPPRGKRYARRWPTRRSVTATRRRWSASPLSSCRLEW
jgi:hypothetical protein